MLNEKGNNIHWKAKLEDTESLSAETLRDKAAAWDKLHLRLREKPRRKGAVPYWIAAACLLVAIAFPFMFVYNNVNTPVKKEISKGATTKPVLKESQLKKEDVVTTVSPVSSDFTVHAEKKRRVKAKTESNYNTAIGDISKEPLETNHSPLTDSAAISSIPATDSLRVTTVATAATKTKLKVVHINELGDLVEESPDIARNTDIHSFQLKLAKEEVFINTSGASVKTRFAIVKIKTSPSN